MPAGFIPGALKAMEGLAASALSGARIGFGQMRAMGNPRRLVLHVRDVAEGQEDSVRVVLGPPKSAAVDDAGNPTKAAAGFARGQGVDVKDLTVSVTDKGEYVAATIEEKGVSSRSVLAA